ncbi:hypothetical protein MIND_01237200 [Mycena indigotica]|uniref:Uncharacterized protein n=1 Tax=Mycena indigotica TaxID=2126181 RepID=A0A8H6S6B6_9AGAR|nr:uncharacterized protein MIND_01237200 [Mycena indigotica]KAF7292105.1 hypothetical protein MIND_01237200 [Mycena indigotica]
MSRSPAPLYNAVCGLSLTHMASSLATILVYDIEDARDSQVIAIMYSMVTFYMVYTLIPQTTSKDNDPVSRLNKQFVIANFLLLCWLLCVGLVPLTVGPGIAPLISSCAVRMFFSPACITLGLDMVIPFALIATFSCLSWRFYHNADHIQSLPPLAPPPAPSSPAPPAPYTDAPPSLLALEPQPRHSHRGIRPLISFTDV